MKLSDNFSLDEFTTSAGIKIVPTNEQIYCLKILCSDVLQPIRDKFGPVEITSGLRNFETFNKLKENGYPASRTSDHFAWSSVNPSATGAADFYCPNAIMKDVFHYIQQHLYDEIGQVIYYPDMNVIHVSNRFNKIFTMNDTRNKNTRVMIYQDGKFQTYNARPPISKTNTFAWPWNR